MPSTEAIEPPYTKGDGWCEKPVAELFSPLPLD